VSNESNATKIAMLTGSTRIPAEILVYKWTEETLPGEV
jgi:hypothetical protein